MPSLNRRTVIRDAGFEATLESIFLNWQQAEDYLSAAETILAADAELGTSMGAGIWTMPLPPVRDAGVWLFYTVYDTVVVLLDVRMSLDEPQ